MDNKFNVTHNFKKFLAIWISEFVLFNAITFLVPNEIFGIKRFAQPVFWIGYALIFISFIIELATGYHFLNNESNARILLGVPLMKITCISVSICLGLGVIFMILIIIPTWIGAILCLSLALGTIIACILSSSAADEVQTIDDNIKQKTFFIKDLTVQADTLIGYASTEDIKEECVRVFEGFRYSDPMSSDLLSKVESQITLAFSDFSDAVKSGDESAVKDCSSKLLALIRERNARCKLLK